MKIPVQLQRSNLPGYVVNTPDVTLVNARKHQGQTTGQDQCVVYHNALKALYQLNDSPRLYYLHDEMKQARTLLGQTVQYLYGQLVQELVPEDQKLVLGRRLHRLAEYCYSSTAVQLAVQKFCCLCTLV